MSSETNSVADEALSQEDIQAGKGEDPGLQHLRDIKLTPEEEANYEKQARSWIPALVDYEASDEGWKFVSKMFGVNVWSTPKTGEDSSSLVVCKGQVVLPPDVSLDIPQKQFVEVYNEQETLAEQMRASDPMSRETRIMYQVPCQDNEFIRIVWGSFKAVGVAWARDFCLLQHGCPMTDPSNGDRLFVVVAHSIERPEVPDMEKLCKRIRSSARVTGYVFREPKDGGPVRVTYVVNVSPNGWIPHKVVNIICNKQATNVNRVRDKICNTAKALSELKLEAPIKAKAVAWRQSYEQVIPRPAAGAPAANVSVKFFATSKVSFRVRGNESGAWVTYAARTPVTLTFTVEAGPGAAAGKEESEVAAPTAAVDSSGVELNETGAGVVLEWKGAGWFQGFDLFHRVEVS